MLQRNFLFRKRKLQKYWSRNRLAIDILRNTTKGTRRFKIKKKVKVKWSRYSPGVAQRVGRGTALLFYDWGTRRGWGVSSTPRPHFTSGKDPVPILQEAGWAPGSAWTGGKTRPHRDSVPDRPAHSQSLYRLSYPAARRFKIPYQYYIEQYLIACYFSVQLVAKFSKRFVSLKAYK